ncbi:MAG TPA: hypothetical protein VGD68_16160 [Streptosporangiaceae bacterium]
MAEGAGAGAADAASGAGITIIVDGANVVGSRPDGWWRDRAGAAVRLHDKLAKLAERGHQGIPAGELAGAGAPAASPGGGAGRGPGQEPGAAPAAGLIPVTVLLVLEGAARAAASRIAERARAAGGQARGAPPGGAPLGGAQTGGAPTGGTRPGGAPPGGGPESEAADGEVLVVSAPGPGDDEIVRQARHQGGHGIVVTADRELRRRCVAVGAQVASPSWLYGLL